MIDEFGRGVGAVFVDYGKCRRACRVVLHAEGTAQGVDKSCLAGTHLAGEGVDGLVAHLRHKLAGGFVKRVGRSDYYLFHDYLNSLTL